MSRTDSGVQQLSRSMQRYLGFPVYTSGEESTCKVGDKRDVGLISGWGRVHGEVNDKPLQYFFLERPMDRGILQATVHGVIKSQIQLCTHTLDIQIAKKGGWLYILQSPKYAGKYLIKEGENACFKGKRILSHTHSTAQAERQHKWKRHATCLWEWSYPACVVRTNLAVYLCSS